MKDYYKILEIDRKATKSEIVKSFRLLAKKYHPDLNKSADASMRFREVYEAYEILVDEHKRINYDNIYNNFYGYSNKQAGASNESDYLNWTQKAQENAKYYSNLKYRDFLKKVLTGFARLTIMSGIYILAYALGIFEFISLMFIVIFTPVKAIDISNFIAFLSVICSIAFAFYYYKNIHNSEEQGLLNVFFNKKALKKYFIYFIALFYSTSILLVAQFHKEQEKIVMQNRYSDLTSHVNDYLSDFSYSYSNIGEKFNKGIVIIDMDKKTIDYDLTNSLPESIKAYENQNVSTIIQLWRYETKVGTYTDNADGIQQSCKYRIIDFKTKEIIGEHNIDGGMPPKTKKGSASGMGSSPIPDLMRQITECVK